MKTQSPKLDNRTSADLYAQALEAAKVYLPQWLPAADPADPAKPLPPDYFNPKDTGLVLLKLLSRMSESALAQLNRVPDKHKLAFYDLLGVELLSARAAKVPLTFFLSKGAASGYVKKGTQVASKENDKVVFETMQDLSVLPVAITEALSFDPWRDRYTFHENITPKPGEENSRTHSLFGYDSAEKRAPHRLHLRNDLLLNVEEASNLTVTITLAEGEAASAKAPLFEKWRHEEKEISSQDVTFSSEINVLTCEVKLAACEEEESQEGHWISVAPREDLEMSYWKNQIPSVENITMAYNSIKSAPSMLFAESTPLEAQKGFYPFGKMPEKRMCFYIGSASVFAKKGAQIKMDVVCDQMNLADAALTLQWEYWNGKEWSPLNVTDHTLSLSTPGAVAFEAPGIPLSKVNGKENRWIRARMDDNIYGVGATYREIANPDPNAPTDAPPIYTPVPATYDPPYISKIDLTYSYGVQAPDEVVSENYFEKEALGEAIKTGNILPYTVQNGQNPAFYIAFNDSFASKALSFLFLLEKRLFNQAWHTLEKPGVIEGMSHYGQREWQYFNGTSWVKVDGLSDDTLGLSEEGIVQFLIPSDISEVKVFGRKRCWLRYVLTDGEKLSSIKIKGIFPNTVMAANAVSMPGEMLGSSNGKPSQVFQISKTPVLEGEHIEVIELEPLSEDERAELQDKENDVTEIKDEAGVVTAWRVRWQKTGEFTLSGPKSRHYMINRQNGEITFGDGKNGMIPPKGQNNIIITYRAGGGTSGNVAPGEITSLKSAISNIESARNMSHSAGGSSQETLDDLSVRAPHTVKTKDRAVTAEDYEWLAKEADAGVYRSRCIRAKDGKIKIMVLPESEERAPVPPAQMLKNIRNYIVERSTFTVSGEIEALGPAYKIIDIGVVFKPVKIAESVAVSERLGAQIRSFFHSNSGNVDGRGWDFGQDIYSSDLSARLENIEGVDYIKDITLSYLQPGDAGHIQVSGIGNIEVGENEIAGYGNITVEAEA